MRRKRLTLRQPVPPVRALSVATPPGAQPAGEPPAHRARRVGACSGATGSRVSPVSLHILINYLERRGLVNSKLIKSSDDANLGGFRETGEGRGNINGTWMGSRHERKIKLSAG